MHKTQVKKAENSMNNHGIRQRWMLNTLIPILILVVIVAVAASVFIVNYYYTSVRTGVEFKAKAAADFVSSYMAETSASYYDTAYEYIQTYEDANKLELQFVNSSGRVTLSSYAMRAGLTPGTADITEALGTGKMSVWRGRASGTVDRKRHYALETNYGSAERL